MTYAKTHATEDMMTMKDTTSALKGLAQRHLEAPCATLVSQSIFGRQSMSSSTMAKLTPVSG
jgi:hypothetical protein